jgi:Ca2+-binding EF-hand superfamily protein
LLPCLPPAVTLLQLLQHYVSTYLLIACDFPAGDIDFEEFKQLVYDGMLLEGAIQEYEDAFNAVDDSGNGSIGEGARSMLRQYP